MRLKERDFFDKIASDFDTRCNAYFKAVGRSRIQSRIDKFSEFCCLKSCARILELGCGTGEYSRRLSDNDSMFVCTDLSLKMINIALSKLKGSKKTYFVICDIEAMPFKEGCFDAIVGNSILHHVDIDRAIPEIYRALIKGGRMAFSEPNMLNPHIFIIKKIKLLKRFFGESLGETAFIKRDIGNKFVKSGFSTIKIEPFDFIYPYMPDLLLKTAERISAGLEKIPFAKEIAGSLFITGEK